MLSKFKLFVEIANVGNVSQAAENLYISQSSASTQLKILEDQLGTQLFDRVGRGIQLNENGKVFLDFAKNTLLEMEKVRFIIQNRSQGQSDKLVICAGNYFNVYYLPMILPLLKSDNYIDIDIVTKHSDEIIHDIEKKNYEFGIVGTSHPIHAPLLQTDFAYTTPLYFVCSPQNSLASRSSVDPEELRQETFIFTRKETDYGRYLLHIMAKYRLNFAHQITARNSLDAVKTAVAGNLGVTIFPQHVVRHEIDAGELVHVQLNGVEMSRMFCCIHNIEKPLSDISRQFIALCIDVLDRQKILINNLSPS